MFVAKKCLRSVHKLKNLPLPNYCKSVIMVLTSKIGYAKETGHHKRRELLVEER